PRGHVDHARGDRGAARGSRGARPLARDEPRGRNQRDGALPRRGAPGRPGRGAPDQRPARRDHAARLMLTEAEISELADVVREWIDDDPDESTATELRELLGAQDWDALEARFTGMLQFGTAGLRGALGGGPNRMNRAVGIRGAQGLAAHLASVWPAAR